VTLSKKKIRITSHALDRWFERCSRKDQPDPFELLQAVQQSRFVKKKEPLPKYHFRMPYTTYSIYNGILFILQSLSHEVFKVYPIDN